MLATLTSKGQLTLPKAARDALDLKSGQRFAVEVSKAGDLILKPQRADALAVRGLLGLAGRTDIVSPGSSSSRFRELDRRLYSPLCLALAALALPAARSR